MVKQPTLIANDLIKEYGTITPLTVQLVDGDNPLPAKPIQFNIHGVDYTRTTDALGVARLNINLIWGSYPCKITFHGDSAYSKVSTEVLVRVTNPNIASTSELETTGGYFEVNQLKLKVVKNNGFNVSHSGSNVKTTKLMYEDGNNNSPSFYFNSGFDGIEFDVSVLMQESYYYRDRAFSDYLNEWDKFNTVVTVVTDAMDIPNGKYTMKIENKKQTNTKQSIWKLEFKQYYENNYSFENIYNSKSKSLSVVDQTLLKYREINQFSPKEAIYALQLKLQQKGCWDDTVKEQYTNRTITIDTGDGIYFKPRKPNGIWDWQMQWDIFGFQAIYGLNVAKQGKCDLETLQTLTGDTYEAQGFRHQGREI